VVREFSVPAGSVYSVAFSPDGRILAGQAGDKIFLWEAATGKEVQRLDRTGLIGGEYGLHNISFSSDGRLLASGGGQVVVWDVASGKRLHLFDGEGYSVAFTSDSKVLLGAGGYFPPQLDSGHRLGYPAVYRWQLTTGKRLAFPQPPSQGLFITLALSPDSRALVTAAGTGREVRLWELATAQERGLVERYDSNQVSCVFSPDGRALATVPAGERAVRVRDVYQLTSLGAWSRKPSSSELEGLWADLAHADVARAYRALCALVRWPDQTLPFVRKRLQPAPQPDVLRIRRLLRELDSEQFLTRQEAGEAIERLGEVTRPALEKLLAEKPSLEVRRRAEELLARVAGWPVTSPERLQVLRSVEVLERIGTPDARRLLETLARGAVDAELTREAKAAVDRLAKRPVSRR
jgi:WD40 repeat protein